MTSFPQAGYERGQVNRPELGASTFIQRVDHHKRSRARRLCGRLQSADEVIDRHRGHVQLRQSLRPRVLRTGEALAHQ